jgi:hypothetical protein
LRASVLIFAAFFITACYDSSSTPTDLRPLKYGESFELKVGQTAIFPDGFILTFNAVLGDSRCPKGCLCIWEGNAAVVLKFRDGTDTLNTMGPQGLSRGAHTVTLLLLSPYPEIGRPIPHDAYIVRLLAEQS